MEIKILQVFYGKDGLPYKDKNRQVHFPIAGTGFLGASNTTQIKFYYDELDNLDETTWVAVSKLPNGKIGSRVLESHTDSELNEHYALLELDSYYTQYKGDVFISLQGYQGGVNVDYDEENSQYEIHGTPTIAATGSIKFTINYANQFVGSGETDNVTLQRILADLGTKLGIRSKSEYVTSLPSVGESNVFYVIHNDPNDSNKANIYIWNPSSQSYIWVGDNTLYLGDYYTKEEGEYFEQSIDERVTGVENELSSVASGSPKGIFPTLSDLETAFPDGDDYIYLVLANGHWYYWDGDSWNDGGAYLSPLPDDALSKTSNNSVRNSVITNELYKAEKLHLLYTPQTDSDVQENKVVNNTNGELEYASSVDASSLINIEYFDRISIKLLFSKDRATNTRFQIAVYDANEDFVAGCAFDQTGIITGSFTYKKWLNLVYNNTQQFNGITFNNDRRYKYLRICWYKSSPEDIAVFNSSNRYDFALEKILRDGGELLYVRNYGDVYANQIVSPSTGQDMENATAPEIQDICASSLININDFNALKFIVNKDQTSYTGDFIIGLYDSDLHKVAWIDIQPNGNVQANGYDVEELGVEYSTDNEDGFVKTMFNIPSSSKAKYVRLCWYENCSYHLYLLGYKNRNVGTKDLLFKATSETVSSPGYYAPDGSIGGSQSVDIHHSEEYIDISSCSGIRFILGNTSNPYFGYNIMLYDENRVLNGNAIFVNDPSFYDNIIHTNRTGSYANDPKITMQSDGYFFNIFFNNGYSPKYMRVCWHDEDLPISFYAIKNLPMPIGKYTKYSNKIMNCMGDSITYGYIPDSGAQMESPYPSLLMAELGLKSIRNYGISGSTLTNKVGSQYYPMCERVNDMDNAADIVCVFGGTNDYGNYSDIQLGTIDSSDTTTIYGALNSIANTLITKYPGAFLFFITPYHRADQTAPKASGLTLSQVAQAIRDIGEKYSIPVLDFYKNGGFHPENNAFKNAGYSGNDRLHPSQKFMEEKMVPEIAHFIERYMGNK